MRFGSSISPEHILTLSCFHISRPIKLAFYINLKASFENYLPVWGQRDQTILNIFTNKSEHIQMLIKFKWERIFLSSAIKLVVKKTFSEIPKNNTAKRFSPPHHPIAGDLPQIRKSHSLTSDHLQLVTAKRFSPPPHHPIAGDLPQISKSHSLTSLPPTTTFQVICPKLGSHTLLPLTTFS